MILSFRSLFICSKALIVFWLVPSFIWFTLQWKSLSLKRSFANDFRRLCQKWRHLVMKSFPSKPKSSDRKFLVLFSRHTARARVPNLKLQSLKFKKLSSFGNLNFSIFVMTHSELYYFEVFYVNYIWNYGSILYA
jgi:hypothetical protein